MPRVPPLDELPQLLRDLRLRRGVRRAGRPRRRPARRGPLDRRASRGRAPGSTDLEAATREAVADDRRPGGRHRRHRGAGGPPLRGQRLAGVLAGVRRGRPGRPAAVDASVTPSGDDRVVVLTGLDTKGLEFDGIVVVRPDEIEAESAPVARRCTSCSPARRSCSARCPDCPRSRRDLPDGTSLTGMSDSHPRTPTARTRAGSRPREPPADSLPMTRTSPLPSRRTASPRPSREGGVRPAPGPAAVRPAAPVPAAGPEPGWWRVGTGPEPASRRRPGVRLRPGPEPGLRPAAAELPDVRRRPGRDGRPR